MLTDSLRQTVEEIDTIIRKELWFDFEVWSYDRNKLIIAGGKDLMYSHQLEIIFENVFYYSGVFAEWKSNTQHPAFIIPSNEPELNLKHEIIQGYQLFSFVTEDFKNNIIIAAESVSYNLKNTLHYLIENER
ncbi:hypothetical protein SAMN05421788_108234 [Filimonas lacunae]|uniref:Uncharacterized protein n=1 Tax=Filimonas lacunae TaxID=477680 RepID=A0A1N7R244_9BACT|nr:hypothetical protein [Filimonas lacunae]SIT29165.1 hypothetical protein SAMN05421788_108234 [Filimonas lacunae]